MGNCLRSNRVMAQDEPYLLPSLANSPPAEAKKFEDKPAGGGSVDGSFTAMGNCLKSNEVMAQDEPYLPSPNSTEAMKVEDKPEGGSAMAKPRSGARGKKVVRFKLQEDENSGEGDQVIGRSGGDGGDGDGAGGGVLRIKVVVSQKELKRILKERENNSSTLEELIAELKVKGRTSTISDARTDEVEDENGSYRPALKSIPEDLH